MGGRERKREREGGRDLYYTYCTFYLYCRITCVTGVKQGSIVSDKVFVTFAHRPPDDRIESEDNFEFVVSFTAMHKSSKSFGVRWLQLQNWLLSPSS